MVSHKYTYEVVDKFPKYNLTAEKVFRNGKDANTQLIVKNDKVVAHFTNAYKVFPNEEAYKTMSGMATAHNLIPANKMPDEWMFHTKVPSFIGSMDGAITALFVDKEQHNLGAYGGKDDWVKTGVGIGNSINGHSSLKAFSFVFRKLCGNYAFHGFHRRGAIQLGDVAKLGAMNDKQVTARRIFIHSAHVDLVDFENAITDVIDSNQSVLKKYKIMQTDKLLERQANEIIRTIPKKVTKNVEWLEWNKKDDTVKLTGEVDQFKAYQDMTEILTHSEDLSYNTKMEAFGKIDRILVEAI